MEHVTSPTYGKQNKTKTCITSNPVFVALFLWSECYQKPEQQKSNPVYKYKELFQFSKWRIKKNLSPKRWWKTTHKQQNEIKDNINNTQIMKQTEWTAKENMHVTYLPPFDWCCIAMRMLCPEYISQISWNKIFQHHYSPSKWFVVV